MQERNQPAQATPPQRVATVAAGLATIALGLVIATAWATSRRAAQLSVDLGQALAAIELLRSEVESGRATESRPMDEAAVIPLAEKAAEASTRRLLVQMDERFATLRAQLAESITTRAVVADEARIASVHSETLLVRETMALVDARGAAVVGFTHHDKGPRVLARSYDGKNQISVDFVDPNGMAVLQLFSGVESHMRTNLDYRGLTVTGLRGKSLVQVASDGKTSRLRLGDSGAGGSVELAHESLVAAGLSVCDAAGQRRIALVHSSDGEPFLKLMRADGSDVGAK